MRVTVLTWETWMVRVMVEVEVVVATVVSWARARRGRAARRRVVSCILMMVGLGGFGGRWCCESRDSTSGFLMDLSVRRTCARE